MPRSACQSDEVVGSLECASVCFLSPPSEQKRFYSKRGIGRIVGRVRGVGRPQRVQPSPQSWSGLVYKC